jgi:sec-independent protein translocase protein TatA
MDIGPTELIIILIIVVLVFGVGRVGKLGGELGNAIREFRQGLNGDKDKQQHPAESSLAADMMAVTPVEQTPAPSPAPAAQRPDTPQG